MSSHHDNDKHSNDLPVEFLSAIETHQELMDRLGVDHPETRRAMLMVMHHAPQSFLDVLSKGMEEFGLKPDTYGYSEDGKPVFRLEDIAEKLGVSEAEARSHLDDMMEEMADLGISGQGMVVDSSEVLKKQ